MPDDDLTREAAAGEAFVAAGAAQNDHHVRTSRAPRGRQTEDGSGGEARNYSEDQHRRIDADGIETREIRRSDGEQFVNSEPGNGEAANGPDGREQQCFGKDLAGEIPPAGSEAVRMASSRWRKEARTNKRLATLAQAMSKRKITAPISARMAGRTSETRCWRIGSTRMA